MNGSDVVDAVRAGAATELDRLGSEKALIAETDAQLDPDAVLASAARAEARARDTFDRWVDDEPNDAAAAAFADLAEREATHYDRIVAELDGEPTADPDPLHEYLRGIDDTAARVGAGLVGRPLASARTLLQVINFFVNEADEDRADLFRDLRSETESLVEEGADLLDTVCEDESDYERAEEAGIEAVVVAYDDYAATLEEMGLDPKPVC